MSKQIIKINEQDLNNIINESITKILKEDYDSNPLFRYYQNIIDASSSELIRTSRKGRAFSLREIGELKNDQEIMELRQEVLDSLESYFYSLKRLLTYATKKCQESGEDFLVKSAQTGLRQEYTPEW